MLVPPPSAIVSCSQCFTPWQPVKPPARALSMHISQTACISCTAHTKLFNVHRVIWNRAIHYSGISCSKHTTFYNVYYRLYTLAVAQYQEKLQLDIKWQSLLIWKLLLSHDLIRLNPSQFLLSVIDLCTLSLLPCYSSLLTPHLNKHVGILF